MKNETTTIKVTKETVERLEKLKIHQRQPLEEVILILLNKGGVTK